MRCGECSAPLDRPGDYCLVCRSANCDAVVVDCARDRTTVTMLNGEDRVGETAVTTVPEDDPERESVELRNFAGRVADEVRRKRPERVFVAGDRDVIAGVRAALHHETTVLRVDGADPVATAVERRGDRPLAVVDADPAEKLGGTHTTMIGGRDGREAVTTVAAHPNVKKIVPGPIDSGGRSARGGVRAKVTRADADGNVRLLVRDGSSVQSNHVVTTARDRETGERLRATLGEALADAGLGGE